MSGIQVGHAAKYQEASASLTEELEADCVMLIVVGGIRGEGFSVSARGGKVPDLHTDAGVARYLRALAERVEKRGPLGRGVRAADKQRQRS